MESVQETANLDSTHRYLAQKCLKQKRILLETTSFNRAHNLCKKDTAIELDL